MNTTKLRFLSALHESSRERERGGYSLIGAVGKKAARALIAAGLLFLLPDLRGALLVYEGFEYTAGTSIAGQAGGIGFGSNTWTETETTPGNLDTMGTGSLSYGSLTANGNRLQLNTPTATGNSDQRNFTAQSGSNYPVMWAGFLINVQAASLSSITNGYLQLRPNSGSGVGAYLGVFTDGGGNKVFGIGSNQSGFTTAFSSVSLALNTTYFLAARVTWNLSGAETIDLFVNPNLDGSGLTPAISTAALSITLDRFARVGLVGGTTGTTWNYDEFRLGQSFAEIAPVPEPSTAMLLGWTVAFSFLWKRLRRG